MDQVFTQSRLVPIDAIEFVKEFYPRSREDDAVIERYRAAIDMLPPITVARGRILVDGFHRWQAHRREGLTEIAIEDLGNLADIEIKKEGYRRNKAHGHQLITSDKKRGADDLYRTVTRDYQEIADLIGVTLATAKEYCREARKDEVQQQKDAAWDKWLDCQSYREIGEELDVDHKTVAAWCGEFSNGLGNSPPASRQHFDIWQFQKADDSEGQASYFGRIPSQVVENLLWFFTDVGDIVVDPFAGGATTIDVCKSMGRRVWSSDIKPSTPTRPIHQHDILSGWPKDAPAKAKLIVLDPPYWQQAKGRYSDSPFDLGNMSLDDFNQAWESVVKTCAEHLTNDGFLAYIISPTQMEDGSVVDHVTDMLPPCWDAGLVVHRRIIVPYQTQQATGQQVEWARDKKRMLKLYRDLVVLRHE